ncbi:uncharacterized protein E6C27_scaffold190G001660 [Cucumis melo var. makuwa]|uniref:RNase H type-1 domain-containing protein n=1 Tax=Cucumis melo var. makuwa TaxID=1194695 RepID=A0A5A7UEF3_CUCMM|nr:uncharacterized protein E6C27_scaffold190G001660 [Cucumis melo var. makuwa]
MTSSAAHPSVFQRLSTLTEDDKNQGCGHVTIKEAFDRETFEEDTEVAPLSLKDGGQSTIDELKEVNHGTIEEPRPTFISVQLSNDDENEYVNLLKEYKDVFALKSEKKGDHLKDLKLVLDRLRKYQLRMNPLKCAFNVTSEKFLGFIVRHRGIKVNNSKIDAIHKMPSSKNLHELRRLQGHLAYIRRFISNLAGRCQPLQRLMRKEAFDWDQTCENAFDSIKKYLLMKLCLGHYLHKKMIREPWTMFIDGATRTSGVDVSIVFISLEKHMFPYSSTLGELCSNNVVKYQALIIGLQMASEFRIKYIEIFSDLKFLINHLFYQYEVKHQDLKPYFIYARRLMDKFDDIILEHISRSEIKKADALANLAIALTVLEDVSINIFLCQKWIVPSIESQYEEADVIPVYTIDEED